MKKLTIRKINIFCIDPNKDSQRESEEGIAENIIKILDNKKTFVILGDVHASKNPVLFWEHRIITAGSIILNKLKNKMFSIRLVPTKGNFYNFGIKEISNYDSNDSFNKGFDYVFKIKEVNGCSFL